MLGRTRGVLGPCHTAPASAPASQEEGEDEDEEEEDDDEDDDSNSDSESGHYATAAQLSRYGFAAAGAAGREPRSLGSAASGGSQESCDSNPSPGSGSRPGSRASRPGNPAPGPPDAGEADIVNRVYHSLELLGDANPGDPARHGEGEAGEADDSARGPRPSSRQLLGTHQRLQYFPRPRQPTSLSSLPQRTPRSHTSPPQRQLPANPTMVQGKGLQTLPASGMVVGVSYLPRQGMNPPAALGPSHPGTAPMPGALQVRLPPRAGMRWKGRDVRGGPRCG